jgi:serine O-acetyltransferase
VKISLSKSELVDYLVSQLNNFFPDKDKVCREELEKNIDLMLQRTEYCFSKVDNKYFRDEEGSIFNHLHGDQYSMFLYFAANTLYKNNSELSLCSKIFQLNKCLYGIDAFYEVELPDIFLFVHPLGTVLGRGKYSDYFVVYQRCNVGSNHGIYPTIGEYVNMHPGSSILGNCSIQKNCKLAADSLLLDRNLEENSIYIGNPKDFVIKKSDKKDPIWA